MIIINDSNAHLMKNKKGKWEWDYNAQIKKTNIQEQTECFKTNISHKFNLKPESEN